MIATKPNSENSRASLLSVAGLHKSYSTPVLTDFQFELLAGEVHALIGSNGAGKSTFARVLSGLTEPDAGEMRLGGTPYRPRSKREAEAAGIIILFNHPFSDYVYWPAG